MPTLQNSFSVEALVTIPRDMLCGIFSIEIESSDDLYQIRPSGDIFSSCTQKSVIKRGFEPGTDGSAPPMVGAREVVLLVVAAVVAAEGALLQLHQKCISFRKILHHLHY